MGIDEIPYVKAKIRLLEAVGERDDGIFSKIDFAVFLGDVDKFSGGLGFGGGLVEVGNEILAIFKAHHNPVGQGSSSKDAADSFG